MDPKNFSVPGDAHRLNDASYTIHHIPQPRGQRSVFRQYDVSWEINEDVGRQLIVGGPLAEEAKRHVVANPMCLAGVSKSALANYLQSLRHLYDASVHGHGKRAGTSSKSVSKARKLAKTLKCGQRAKKTKRKRR